MKKYRIRIVTQKDGKLWYAPQECTLSIFGIWVFWVGLNKYGYPDSWYYFHTLEEAEEAILKKKKLALEEEGKKITKIEYKYE